MGGGMFGGAFHNCLGNGGNGKGLNVIEIPINS
jgi:hypothetical protein